MGPAVVLLLLCQQEAPLKIGERVILPARAELDAWAARSEGHRKAVALISDLRNWEEGIRKIERKLGLDVSGAKVSVRIEESDSPSPAAGGGSAGVGTVTFNLRRMIEYDRKLQAFREAEKSGKRVDWIVPPNRLEDVVHHELVHVFTGTFGEAWLTEGLAAYVAGDASYLIDFAHRKAPLEAIDRPVAELDAYARGWAFFAWLEAARGAGAVRAFVAAGMKDRSRVKEAAEAAAGQTWERLRDLELEWSRAYLAGFKRP